ncbi:hypothetical protein BGW42_006896 [Actinomortierella wolfii]|nr:hypothetical protein BGW42_006896 [Actinomortierella wolfii]
MCRSHADELKKTGVEDVREQVEELQKELGSKYQHLDEAIRSQTDIGFLNYIDMTNCDGPDETTMVAIKETIETDAFQDIFIHEEQEESGDEDDERLRTRRMIWTSSLIVTCLLHLQCSQSSTELPSDPTIEVLQSEVTAATDEEGEQEVEDEVDDYVEEEEERLHRTHYIR